MSLTESAVLEKLNDEKFKTISIKSSNQINNDNYFTQNPQENYEIFSCKTICI